jgi:cell division protein FtsW
MNILALARTQRNPLSAWWWTIDRSLLMAALGLMSIGIMLVMAASPAVAERIGAPSMHFITRHLAVLVPALLVMIGMSMVHDARTLWRIATFVLLGAIIGMIAVPFVGSEIKGAQRWISLPGFSLQPSEFAKPAFAVFAAWLIARQKEQANFPGHIMAVGIYLVTVILMLLQPDLGMSVVLTAILGAQVFLAGLPFRYLIGCLGLAVVLLTLAYFGFSHVQSRIDRFLDPASGDNYQIEQSISAFQNGGLTGTGAGQGTVKTRLPDAHADFIFSVAGEEGGFLFIAFIIGLYGFVLWRGWQHLMNTSDMFIILACGGLLTMFGLQALVHMASSLHLMPTKGMTLPFISYGGSSLLSIGFGFGMLLSLTRHRGKPGITGSGLSGHAAPYGTNP